MANLLDKINARRAGGTAPAAPANAPAAPASAPAAPGAALAGVLGKKACPTAEEVAADKAAEIAKLQAEEAEQRGRRVVVELIAAIEAYNLGKPALGGEAARLYNFAKGLEHAPHSGVAGTGDLGGIDGKNTVEELKALLGELQAAATSGAIPGPAAPLPEAPATAAPTDDEPAAILPPEAPEVPPAAPAASAPPPAAEPAAQPEAPKRRGRPPGSRSKPTETEPTGAGFAGSISLYINCVVTGSIQAEDLWTHLDKILADAHADLGIDDIRSAPDSSGIGFGKWKGGIAAAARGLELPPGHYAIDTRGSEIGDIFAEALAARARASGGAVVRGIR